MGAGRARGDLNEIANMLIQAAISHQENVTNSSIEEIYFLAWTNAELEVCQRILQADDRLRLET
jgi:hypothetical protein